MSVQSEINRISSEVTTQTSLLAELDAAVDALPDADGGGGTVEIWEFTLDDDSVVTKEVYVV